MFLFQLDELLCSSKGECGWVLFRDVEIFIPLSLRGRGWAAGSQDKTSWSQFLKLYKSQAVTNQQGTMLLCQTFTNCLAIGAALTVMDIMARFGSHRDLGWKKGWYPLHSQKSVNTRRVFHPWPQGSHQARGCVVAGTACTKCTPWPTVPKHTEPPDRSVTKPWAHISRLPAEQGSGAKTRAGLLEGTWKSKARKIFISAFFGNFACNFKYFLLTAWKTWK